eukprot:Rmarinus@m.27942
MKSRDQVWFFVLGIWILCLLDVVNALGTSTPFIAWGAAPSGNEDQKISLQVVPTRGASSDELVRVFIKGMPSNSKFLPISGFSSSVGGGKYTLAKGGTGFGNNVAIAGLSISVSAQCDKDFTLTVRCIADEGGLLSTEETSTSKSAGVTLIAKADTPAILAAATSTTEDKRAHLPVTPTTGDDTDGSEWFRLLTIKGIPPIGGVDGDVTFSSPASTSSQLSTLYTLTSLLGLGFVSGNEITSLSVTPPDECDVDLLLTYSVYSVENNGKDRAST